MTLNMILFLGLSTSVCYATIIGKKKSFEKKRQIIHFLAETQTFLSSYWH